ncbi:MAG: hypothetical protein ACRC3Y_02730 [Romboutsia sp.]|uniref:hypothetical protein n=1 Tax=Romboutsia sp. TaxID=1965302 RepID=UPI003F337CBC
MKDNNEEMSLFWKCLVIGWVIGTFMGFLLAWINNWHYMIRYVGFSISIGTGAGSSIGMILEKRKQEKESK